MDAVCSLIPPLVMTVITESVVALIIGVRGYRQFIVIIVMNLITNPLINLALRWQTKTFNTGGILYCLTVFVYEIIVVMVEGFFIDRLFSRKLMNPYLLSFFLNLSSFAAGILFYGIL